MKAIIIYKSKYGSTKQYAQWLQEETGFELVNVQDFSQDLREYDGIVVAGSIHAGALSLNRFLLDNWPSISGKIVSVLVTSGAGHQDVVKEIIKKSIPPEVYEKLHIFPVGGHYVLKDMSFIDRTIIRFVASWVKRPDVKQGMLTDKSNVNKENLQGIIDFLESIK